MNPATPTQKPTLKHKLSNGFVLFTAIWSSVIMPSMPSYAKMLSPDELPTLGSDSAPTDDNKVEQFIAEYSQSAAHFIADKKSTKDLADMAQDYARNKVTHTATNEINRWLSKTGNAKFSVDVDKKLAIKNTQLDWLIPWYDQPDLLLFTQHNIHRTDGRLQTNNGIGVRRFTPESMMGVNAFFDHDLSRYHSRLGFGAEYAQDFLKLSANTYLRTSSWRSTSELDNDYNARPANGWDLQAEGWLPSYPNIGGNLKFEQYFGDDVALFGKDKRQKDPLATTVGVNWTPFSLVTLSAEHKISGGLSETNAKVQFTWALGKSLAEQLDPTKVGDSRRLLGNRYDFVNRNNNIVLEYQKKTLISLSLPAIIQGKTGDELPIINSLNTKYPLDKIVVQAPEFLNAGGKITLNGTATKVTLPSYKEAMTESERKKTNLYPFTVIASDTKGNITPQATTWVEVTDYGVLSISQSETIKKGNAIANGQDINILTVTARDVLGHIAPNSVVTFTLPTELKLVTQKATSSKVAFANLFKKMQAAKSTSQKKYRKITNMKGEASIQFTSLTTGEHRIQAFANGGKPVETAFFFIADTHQAHINHFNILSDNAVANGNSKNKIQFHITDNNAHPIQGAMLQLDAINANATQLSPTDEQGNTAVEVDSQKAGSIQITATLNQQSVAVKVNFVSDQLAHVTILNLAQAAAGSDSTITISLTDRHDNAVSGADGTAIVNINGKPTPVTMTETFAGSGVYTGTLPGQHSGMPSVTVTIDGQTSSPETLIVEQSKPISPNNSNGTGQKGEKGVIDSIVIAPNKNHNLQSGNNLDITVTVTDAFGNGLAGLNTDNIDIGKHKGSTLSWVDKGDGSYTTTLILTEVGNNDLTASVNGTQSPLTEVQVNNATGTSHVDKVKITKTEKPAAGTDSIMTIELTDKHGNPVVGETEITVNIDGVPQKRPVIETQPGIYEIIIKGQQAGGHDISISVNGEESKKETLVVDKPQTVQPTSTDGTGAKGELGVVDKIKIVTGNIGGLQSGDKVDITVTITDAFDNGLAGLDTKNINIGKHKGSNLKWADNKDGTYSTTLELTEIGNTDLTASINNQTTPAKTVQVGNAKGTNKVSKVEITKVDTPAAGEESILTVELFDQHGNPVVGEQEIVIEINGKPHTLPAKEGTPGIYEVTLPALQAGKHDIHASVNSTTSIKESLLVELPKPISPNNSNGTGQKGEKGVIDSIVIAPNKNHNLQSGNNLDITVTVTDAFGNGLAGLNTDNIDIGKHKGSTLSWVDKGDGSYTTTLILTEVGNNDLTASVNGTQSPLTEVQVNNATGTSHVDKVKITKTEKPAAGTDSIMTIELTDKHGNPVVGETEITVNIDGVLQKRPVTETKPGIYQATLPAQHSGNHDISVTVNGKESKKEILVVDKPQSVQPTSTDGTGAKGELGVVDKIEIVTGNIVGLQSGDKVDITVTITDAFDNGLAGLDTKNINIGKHKGSNLKWADNKDGTYSTTLELTEIGNTDLTASINNQTTPAKTVQVGNAKGTDKVSKVEITKVDTPATGEESTLTVELFDQHGNPVVGEQEIVIKIDNKPYTLPVVKTTGSSYQAKLPAFNAGNYTVIATINGKDSATHTLTVKKPTPINSKTSSGTGNSGERGVINNITMTMGDITRLQSGDKLDITVTLADAFNNPLTAIDTSNITLDGYKASSLKWLDKGNGTYTAQLLLTKTGSNDLFASINGHKSQVIPITVRNTADINKVANIEFEPITPSEAGENQSITVKVTDKYQHPVTTINSMITANINNQSTSIVLTESPTQEGTYTGTLPAQNTGKYTVKATANKKTASKTWTVKTAATLAVKEKDGSGTEDQRGVVKTVALTSSSTNDLKSGQSLQLTVTLKDAFGNYLEGVESSHIQLQQKQVGVLNWTDNRNGSYTAILPLTKIGQDALVVAVNKKSTSPVNIKVGNATGTTQIKKVAVTNIGKLAAGEPSTITLALTDANNQPITGIDNNAIVSIDGADELLKIAEVPHSKGTYTGTLSGQKSGDHKIIVTVGGVKSTESTLAVSAPAPIAINKSGKPGSRGVVNSATLTVSPNKNFMSGGTVKLTATLKDAFDNSLTGVDLAQSLIHSQQGQVTWGAQQDGTYTASLVLTQLGQDHLFITANKIQSPTVVIDVKPQLSNTAIHKIDITDITTTTAGAEGAFTVSLTDNNGHAVMGIAEVTVNIAKQQPLNITVTQQADGRYTGTLPGLQSGDHDVIISANNKLSTAKTLTVAQPDTVTAAANGSGKKDQRGVVSHVELKTTTTSSVSGDNLQLTVTLKDAFNNPLKGVTSDQITLKHKQTGNVIWTDNNNGKYTTTLPLKVLGKDTLTATVNSINSSVTNITVENTADIKQVSTLKLDAISPSEAGKEQTITVKALDIHQNGVTKLVDSLKVTLNDVSTGVTFTESPKDSGTYTAALPPQKAGNYTVKVSANKKQSQQTWIVEAAKAIQATQNDGSGVQGKVGVVKTVELKTITASSYKSGDTVTLTLALKDAFDNPLKGIDVKNITLTHNQTGNVAWVDGKDGTYTADLLLTTLGKDSLVTTVSQIKSAPVGINVEKATGNSHIHKVEIDNITSPQAGAKGAFTFSLTDNNGHAVMGIAEVTVKIAKQSLNITVTQQADGRYTGTLPGLQSGDHAVIISANNKLSTAKTLTVAQPDTVTAAANGSGKKDQRGVVSHVELKTTTTSSVSGDNLQLTVTLKDAFNNPLKGVTSDHITLKHKQTDNVIWTDNNNGKYTATLPLKVLGKDKLTATVNSINSSVTNITVENTADIKQVSKLDITAITQSAAGTDQQIIVQAVDINNHGVAQITDDIKVTLNDKPVNLTFVESKSVKGTYTAALPPQKAGNYMVKVSANKKQSQQTWIVEAAKAIQATQNDGSGVQGKVGVVKTVELKTITASSYKSGDTVTLTLALKDAFDNPLKGIDVKNITLTHNQTSNVTWVDNQNGTYTANLPLIKLGKDALTVTVNNINSQSVDIEVIKSDGVSKVKNVDIVYLPEPIAGMDSTLILSLTDSNGHPVTGVKNVTVEIDNQPQPTISVSLLLNGNYILTLPGQQAGSHNMTISANGQTSQTTLIVKSPTTIVAKNSKGNGTKGQSGVVSKVKFNTAQSGNLHAGNHLVLTVTLEDSFSNTLSGIDSNSIAIAHQQSGSVTWKDNADGTYTTDLLLSKLGTDTLKVTVNGIEQSQMINVETPQSKSAVDNVELMATNKTFRVGDSVKLQLTLKDSHGNGVEKVKTSDIRLEHNNTLASKLVWQEQSAGVYTTTLPLHKQGKQIFVGRVNNQESRPMTIDVSELTGSINVNTVELKASTNQLTVGSTTELTLQLTDQWNNGVEGVNANDIVINDSHTKKDLTSLIWKYQRNGIYTTPITLSMAGIHSLRAKVNQQQSTNVLIEVKPSTDSNRVHKVTLTSNSNVITAGNKVTLSLKVTDIDNNPVISLNNNTMTLTNNSKPVNTVWTEGSHGLGIYTTSIMLSDVKTHNIVVGIGKFTDTTNITVNSPMGKDAVKTITISPIADSDAGQPSSLSISLTDQYNNPIKNIKSSDIKVTINGAIQNIVFMETNKLNRYIAQLPAAKASNYKIIVEVNNQSEKVNWKVNAPTEIPITSYDKNDLRGSLETISIISDATANTANSGDKVTLTVGLKDKFGNKLTGAATSLKLLTNLKSTSAWKELNGGFYAQELIMNKLHSQPIAAMVKDRTSSEIQLTINPAKGASKVHKTTLETDVGTIEAGKEVLLTLALTDSVDNGVIDVNASDIQLTKDGKPINVKWGNPQDGVYTTTQRLETVGHYQFKATVNKKPSRIQTVEAVYQSGKDAVKFATMATNINTFDAGKEVELTLELKDQYGNLVTGITGVDIALKDSHISKPIDSSSIAWNMESAGVYKATLPLTKVGQHTLTATVNNVKTATKAMTVKALAGVSSVKEIKLTSAKTSMNAGESTTLTLTLLDNYGNEVANVAPKDIQFKNTDIAITTQASWVQSTQSDGVYTANITLEKVKTHTLSVEVNKQVKNIEIDVKPLEGAKNVAKVELNVPATAKLGVDTTLRLQLKDNFGNGVINVASQEIQLTDSGQAENITWVEDSQGKYTANWQSTRAGVHRLDVKVNNNSLAKPTEISVSAPKGAQNVATIKIDTLDTAKAGDDVTVTLKLQDKYGNDVINVNSNDIVLTDSNTSEKVTQPVWKIESTGEYKATLPLTKVGQHTLTATVNNVKTATKAMTVNALKGTSNVKEITLTADHASMNAGESTTLTLTSLDSYGNEVADVALRDIKFKNTDSTITTQASWVQSTKSDGVYTTNITLQKVQQHKLFVEVNKQTKNIEIDVKPLEGAKNVAKVELNVPATTKLGVDTPLTLQLKDKFGNGVINIASQEIQLTDSGKAENITWVEGSQGKYTANWQSTKVGKHKLDVVVSGNRLLKPFEIIFPIPQGAKSVEVININVLGAAKVEENVTVTLKLQDNYGNGVIDISSSDITLSSDKQVFSSLVWSDDKHGNYSTSVKFNTGGQHTLTVNINNSAKTTEKKAINIKTLPPVFGKGKSEFSVDTDSVEGNGKDQAIVTLKLIDKNNTPISGKKPNLTLNSGTLGNTVMTEISTSGVYTAAISNKNEAKITVTLNSNSVEHEGANQETDIYFYSFQDINYPINTLISNQYISFYPKDNNYKDYTWENNYPDVIGITSSSSLYVKGIPKLQKNVMELIARPKKNSHKLKAIRAKLTIRKFLYASDKETNNQQDSAQLCKHEGNRLATLDEINILYKAPSGELNSLNHKYIGARYWVEGNNKFNNNGYVSGYHFDVPNKSVPNNTFLNAICVIDI